MRESSHVLLVMLVAARMMLLGRLPRGRVWSSITPDSDKAGRNRGVLFCTISRTKYFDFSGC